MKAAAPRALPDGVGFSSCSALRQAEVASQDCAMIDDPNAPED
jgi:hypothetical protein